MIPVGILVLLMAAGAVRAQQNGPTIGYVYPAGGRQGSSFEVTVGGQFLQGVAGAVVSGKGVHAEVVERVGPVPQRQLDELREKARQLRERKQAAAGMGRGGRRMAEAATQPAWNEEDEKELARTVERLETFARTRVVPALGDSVALTVSIDRDAPEGMRTLRLEAAGGVTNPMVFCVGRLPEFAEKVAKGAERFGISEEGQPRRAARRDATAEEPVEVTLPAVVNGQILAGDRDRWRFRAKKGQRIVVAVQARQLLPYLADAVPGWFQALVSVRDVKGEELACADHWRFDPDPAVSCIIPADGLYTVEITDALFRGREDFVYRASIGQLPFVTSIFPLGGTAGALTTVQVTGWNLPKGAVGMNCAGREPGVYPLGDGREWFVNRVAFAVDDLPEVVEREPNDEASAAQVVERPVIVNGRIEQAGVADVFRFEGKAGETVVAEVMARRLGSPLDSAVRITGPDGKQVAFSDDFTDKAAGLLTHHADSWVMAKLPADGTYCVHVWDMQRKAGLEYAYRLRISAPRPDFALRVTPSAINMRGGETVPLTVHAIRRDGFDGEIRLALKDGPEGLVLSGAVIPAGQEQVRATLSAKRRGPGEPGTLNIDGRATIAGREVVRRAVPADDQMQAFAYRHLVVVDQLEVCIAGRPFPRGAARILSPMPVNIPAGGQAELEVALPRGPLVRDVQVELSDPPEGIRILRTVATGQGLRIVLRCEADKVKPGAEGNLVFAVFGERAGSGENKAPRRRFPLGTLPAVRYAVVAGR